MLHISFVLVTLLFYVSFAEKSHPLHVVIIVGDDMGVDDVGYSSEWAIRMTREHPDLVPLALSGVPSPIQTPSLDSLANEGYYTHPTCTPSRIALLTGRYAGLPLALLGKAVAGVPRNVTFFPKYMKDLGYTTHLVGKWHAGHSKEWMTPTKRGFDTFFGYHGWGIDNYKKERDGCVDLWNGTKQFSTSEIDKKDHATNLFTREAVKIIHEHAKSEEPMFLYLGYSAAHDPLQADSQYLEKCKDVKNPTRQDFCAMMAQLDAGIANITTALRETGMLDDTLILFTSDNGGNPSVGGYNYPFTGTKAGSFEGAIRAPAFILAPPKLNWKKGEYDGLVHISDWMPTILSLVQQYSHKPVTLPTNLDGVDMSSALANLGASPRQSVMAQMDIFLNTSAYRNGCYKLVLGCTGVDFLFREPKDSLQDTYMRDKNIVTEAFQIFDEKLQAMTEYIFSADQSQFAKYMLAFQLNQLDDFQFDKTTQNMFTKYQHYDIVQDPLSKHLPLLDFSHQRTRLYNVCNDPAELHNLAESNPDILKDIYSKMLTELTKNDPMQYACDAEDKNASVNANCAPWLGPDEVVPQSRLFMGFQVMHNKMMFAELVIMIVLGTVLLSSVICCACCCYCCCCKKHKKVHADVATNKKGTKKSKKD